MQALSVLPLAELVWLEVLEEVLPPGGFDVELLLEPPLLPQAASATAATTAHVAASPVCSGRNTVILSTLRRLPDLRDGIPAQRAIDSPLWVPDLSLDVIVA
jgi:hypothetical protein